MILISKCSDEIRVLFHMERTPNLCRFAPSKPKYGGKDCTNVQILIERDGVLARTMWPEGKYFALIYRIDNNTYNFIMFTSGFRYKQQSTKCGR